MTDRDFIDATVEPQPDDSTDVRWALETAVAMWIRGSREQTLKWLHTAMQTATGEGRHDRAYALGRVLSELENRPLPQRRPSPPVVAPGPASTTQPLDLGKARAATSRPSKSMLQTSPYRAAPEELTAHFAPDSELLDACQTSTPELEAERAAADSITDVPTPEVLKVPQDRPRPPSVMSDGLDATLVNVRPGPPVSRDHVERTVVMTTEELMAPSVRNASPPTTVGSPQTTLEPMRALRVAIASGQGRQIVLRLLDEGEAAPEGTQEALLIALGRPTR